MKALACLVLLLLSGCIQETGDSALLQDAPSEPAKIIVQPGEPFILESKTLTGNVAFDLLFHEAPGNCTWEAGFTSSGHAAGPVYFTRDVDKDGEGTGYYSSLTEVNAWAAVAGGSTEEMVPATNFDGGLLWGPRDVSQGARSQFWATDLAMREGARFGRAIFVQVMCTAPTELTLRASREALLATPLDFNSLAGAGVGMVGDATVFGFLAERFSSPADWWYFSNFEANQFDLGVVTPAGERHWTEPNRGSNQAPLPAGGVDFYLTSAGVGFQFLVGAAAWQPVHSMAEVEALPSWV